MCLMWYNVMCNNVKLSILVKYEIYLMKNIMLHDLLKFHFKLMILFHITFICTLYDIVLPNKYLPTYQVWSIWGKAFLNYQVYKVK